MQYRSIIAVSDAINCKNDAELRKLDELVVNTEISRDKTAAELLIDNLSRIEAVRRPLLDELAEKKQKLDLIKKYTAETAHLRNIDIGAYKIIAVRKEQTRYGENYRMLLEVGDEKKEARTQNEGRCGDEGKERVESASD